MRAISSTTVVVLNPGSAGDFPPFAIGITQNSTVGLSAAPAATPLAVPSRSIAAGNAPAELAALSIVVRSRLQPLQPLQQRAASHRHNRTVAAASLITTGTMSAVGAMALLGNTVANRLDSSEGPMSAPELAGRFAGVALATWAAAGMITAGAILGTSARERQGSRHRLQGEMPVSVPENLVPDRVVELREVIIHVEESDGGSAEVEELAVPDTQSR